tara:strand:+ start:591 stop:1712 length:1122 start_codon:yes stop_codon:yes gene_type:complete
MKIGFDAKRAFLNNTGLGNYSRDSIRILGSFYPNNQYHLYTPKATSNPRLSFLENQAQFHVNTPVTFINNTFSGIWRSVLLSKQLQKDGVDIYHGLSNELPKGIEKTKIKTVVTIHDLIFIRYPHLFKAINRKIYYHKFLHACQVADHIIAVSQQTKEDIMEFFAIPAHKITVVYQGCHHVFQSEITQEEKEAVCNKHQLPSNYLLYVGSIEERKNLLTLLKSMKELPEQYLVVIGDGKQYKKQCLKFVEDNNLNQRINFLTGLSLNEMAAIYQSAEMMIYPSIFEGFGIPILEALFCNIPVITSKDGCFSESGGSHSYYINPLDKNELTQAIKHIQSDKNLREHMIIKGQQHAQKFTDKKIAENLMNIYQSL